MFNRIRNNETLYLLIILGIAAFFRLILLGSIPGGFSCDEGSFGYEAFSFLNTGSDRYGVRFPVFLKLFGNDYPASLYVFLSVPWVKLLGVTEFSTRLVAALAGITTVFVVYLLAKAMFTPRVGLIAAFLLAISPWHIHFSRIAYNLIFLPLVFCVALLFFVRSFKKPAFLPWSGLFFGISLYTYSSARVFTSLFVMGLVIVFRRHLWRHKTHTAIASGLFLAIFFMLLRFWLSPQGMARVKGTGLELNLISIVSNYLSHFSPNFLFFQGGGVLNENPTQLGELYLFEFITVVVGLVLLRKENKYQLQMLMMWLALYPLPAALVDLASPQRSIVGAPVFAIISAYGLVQLMDLPQARKQITLWLAASVLLVNLSTFSYRYFLNYSPEASRLWNYGLKQAIHFAEASTYQGVVISSDVNSSCFALYDFLGLVPFYTRYPPSQYQQAPLRPWLRGLKSRVYTLGKYHLLSLSRQTSLNEQYLYLLPPQELAILAAKDYQWTLIHSIQDAQGITYFHLVTIQKK